MSHLKVDVGTGVNDAGLWSYCHAGCEREGEILKRVGDGAICACIGIEADNKTELSAKKLIFLNKGNEIDVCWLWSVVVDVGNGDGHNGKRRSVQTRASAKL